MFSIHTTVEKFEDFLMFLNVYAHQGHIYFIKNTVETVILWYIITI